ncbi:hypothetical protein A2U01_0050310, partial [Trifolium medium]|nr:hypothetical protein [Trifolium medium]
CAVALAQGAVEYLFGL